MLEVLMNSAGSQGCGRRESRKAGGADFRSKSVILEASARPRWPCKLATRGSLTPETQEPPQSPPQPSQTPAESASSRITPDPPKTTPRRETHLQRRALRSQNRVLPRGKSPASSIRITFHNDGRSGKTDANWASRSSRFLISLVEAGVAQ